jgi:hypothetical protein
MDWRCPQPKYWAGPCIRVVVAFSLLSSVHSQPRPGDGTAQVVRGIVHLARSTVRAVAHGYSGSLEL